MGIDSNSPDGPPSKSVALEHDGNQPRNAFAICLDYQVFLQ
jgi:hypothetical protein